MHNNVQDAVVVVVLVSSVTKKQHMHLHEWIDIYLAKDQDHQVWQGKKNPTNAHEGVCTCNHVPAFYGPKNLHCNGFSCLSLKGSVWKQDQIKKNLPDSEIPSSSAPAF